MENREVLTDELQGAFYGEAIGRLLMPAAEASIPERVPQGECTPARCADELALQISEWLWENPGLKLADVKAAIDRRFPTVSA